MEDTFRTISGTVKGLLTEKKSKFVAYAFPVTTVEEVKYELDKLKKEYYDARHICWAYVLGAERKDFRVNDDGEPSGTAGKPILGQLNSNELTNTLIAVVRYFGGIKLGTGGLISAYKEAAHEAIENAEIIEKTVDLQTEIIFEYPFLNEVMKIVKELQPTVVQQLFEMNCSMTLQIRKAHYPEMIEKLKKVESLYFKDDKLN